jgi:hypothetical protein
MMIRSIVTPAILSLTAFRWLNLDFRTFTDFAADHYDADAPGDPNTGCSADAVSSLRTAARERDMTKVSPLLLIALAVCPRQLAVGA